MEAKGLMGGVVDTDGFDALLNGLGAQGWNLLYVSIACAIALSVIANAHVLPEKKNWRQPVFWREKDDFTRKDGSSGKLPCVWE